MLRHSPLIITLACVLGTGCQSPTSADRLVPDKLRSGPLALEETGMTATISDGEVTLQVPVILDEGKRDTVVELRLINLAAELDTTVAKETVEITLNQPGATVSAKLSGLNAGTLGDLAKYVVEAVVTAGDDRVRARRSLFTAVPRLALHAVGSRQLALGGNTVFRSFVRDASSGEIAAGVVVDFGIQQGEGVLAAPPHPGLRAAARRARPPRSARPHARGCGPNRARAPPSWAWRLLEGSA